MSFCRQRAVASTQGGARAVGVTYELEVDPDAREQITALSAGALIALAEAMAMLEVTPWNGAPLNVVRLVTSLLDDPYTSRQATYDLRRLKRKGLIVRLPGRHRYQLTPLGRRVAVLFTKTYGRVLTPGLAALNPRLPPDLATRIPLATAWRQLDHTLDQFITNGLTAA